MISCDEKPPDITITCCNKNWSYALKSSQIPRLQPSPSRSLAKWKSRQTQETFPKQVEKSRNLRHLCELLVLPALLRLYYLPCLDPCGVVKAISETRNESTATDHQISVPVAQLDFIPIAAEGCNNSHAVPGQLSPV